MIVNVFDTVQASCTVKYFAYGSNMSQRRMVNERNVVVLTRYHALLHDYILSFNKQAMLNSLEGKANIVRVEGGITEGVLYEIHEDSLATLDSFEGFPDHYKRIKVTVHLDNGRSSETYTYIAQPNQVKDGLKPTGEYLGYLLEARRLLSRTYVDGLERVETLAL